MNAPPHPTCTRLQNLVATMLLHGNTPDNLNIERLASFNKWTSAADILAEFKIQQNGSRKLPEEVAVAAPPIPASEEVEE